jgi:hypothetical protein
MTASYRSSFLCFSAIIFSSMHEQPHDGDGPVLPDAMCPIGSLILHRRISPRIHMKDVRRSSQIQPLASRFEAQKKHARLVGSLKLSHSDFTRRRRSGSAQPVAWNGMPVACALYEVQKRGESGEDLRALPLIQQHRQVLMV